jgi:hypothetical protein
MLASTAARQHHPMGVKMDPPTSADGGHRNDRRNMLGREIKPARGEHQAFSTRRVGWP